MPKQEIDPTTEVIQWVFVGARLPQDDRSVLVCCDRGYVFIGHYEGSQWYSDCSARVDIQFWAELPKGPQVGEE